MNRILVAVDFSPLSRKAFRAAAELARVFEANLSVVHVLSRYDRRAELEAATSALTSDRGSVQRHLQGLVLEEFRGGGSEFAKIEVKVLEGQVGQRIVEEAQASDASLIVVGSNGQSGMERFILGSVSSRIVNQSPLPVLVVHDTSQPKFRRILAAIDGHESTKDVLTIAADWSKALEAELRILHVMPELSEPVCVRVFPDSDLRETTRELMRGVRSSVDDAVITAFPGGDAPKVDYCVGSPAREIRSFADEEQFDLAIIGSHQKRGALDLKNVMSQVAQRCVCAVLIAKPGMVSTETGARAAALTAQNSP